MSRHKLDLTASNRPKAIQWVDHAIKEGAGLGRKKWVLEVREPTRNDEQNRALWELIAQIMKARPLHNGIRYSAEMWKCAFMTAVGMEVRMVPNLDGNGVFPMGHKSSQLTIAEFSMLLEFILAWTAEEGIEIKHFDEPERAAA